MKVKKVNRYYCDFCKKSGCNKHALEQHEQHCTMNPHRECRMCDKGDTTEYLTEALSVLPNPKNYEVNNLLGGIDYKQEFYERIPKDIQAVKEMMDGCPACVLAAMRQKGIHLGGTGYDYKKECEDWWSEINAERQANCGYGYDG